MYALDLYLSAVLSVFLSIISIHCFFKMCADYLGIFGIGEFFVALLGATICGLVCVTSSAIIWFYLPSYPLAAPIWSSLVCLSILTFDFWMLFGRSAMGKVMAKIKAQIDIAAR